MYKRQLYQHFLSEITEKSLNVFYYACSYAKVDYSRFMNTTVRIALKLIPDSLQTQPVFLCVDDTMVSKFDTKFENVSKLFQNLDLIGNARIDSVMYDLAPARTGHRGCPAKHGKHLSIENDFMFSGEKIGDYYTGIRRGLTKIFGNREVLAYSNPLK